MKTLTLFLSLLSSLAVAQVGLCKSGAKCVSRDFKAQGDGTAALPSWSWQADPDTGFYRNGVDTLNVATGGVQRATWGATGVFTTSGPITMPTNSLLSIGASGLYELPAGRLNSGSPVCGPAGTAALPTFSFTNDPNSGFYNVGADQLGVATAGARSFNFNATAGELEGTSSTLKLALNANGSTLTYGATSMSAQNLLEVHSGATEGIRLLTDYATAWGVTYAQVMQVDARDGRMYWSRIVRGATSVPVDHGGHPHPITQQHLYGLDMGYESNATPTFYPVAPRLGGAAATVTPVDAAVAGTQVLGAAPYQVEARSSITTAAAGSISTMVTSAFIRRAGAAPRWCQKVSISGSTSIRVWLGIASALPGASDSPANSGQSFRYSTNAGDTKWQYCYANGVSTTCADSGVAPNTGTGAFDTLCIDCREGGTTACTWWINGVARARVTSGLGSGYPFFPYYSVEALAASARTLYAGSSSVEIN